MTPHLPVITIVVVTWNSASTLRGLIASLPDAMAGLTYELVIADNDSSDDSVALALSLSPTCVIVQTGRNAGYAAAFNAGLAAASSYDAALVLNADVRLSPGSVRRLYEELGPNRDGVVGITVPLIRNEDGSVARSLRREPTIRRALGEAVFGQRAGHVAALGETVMDERAYGHGRATDWATGAVMLMSRSCLVRCGPWDESFFLYSEETEFALRAHDMGFTTRFVPEAEATHLGGESQTSSELWSLLQVNRLRLYRKRHSTVLTAAYWAALLLRESSRAILGHPRSRRAVVALFKPSSVANMGNP